MARLARCGGIGEVPARARFWYAWGMPNSPYREFRPDGWPFCPCCGEDELYSLLDWDGEGEQSALQQYLDAEMRCYWCDWSSVRAAEIEMFDRLKAIRKKYNCLFLTTLSPSVFILPF
jgi:hypothetical protein